MSAEENEAIARRFFAEFDSNHGRLPPELTAPNYTMQANAFPVVDRAGHEELAAHFFGAFPDLLETIGVTVADEHRVAMRFQITGTHQGEFMGTPASGKSIDISGLAILELDSGKVSSLREVLDLHTLLQQIGLAPP